MVLSLVVATALWLLPVCLAFLGPNREGWQGIAMAFLLPASLLALMIGFLIIEPIALGGGALATLVIVLVTLFARGGRPGRSVARMLLLALAPALLLCVAFAWAAFAFRGL